MSMVHPMARTTPRTRAEIHESQAGLAEVDQTYNISRGTARKWRNRSDHLDRSHRAHQLPTTLSPAQEVIVMEIRRLCLLPLDDLVSVTREFINADASRSGISRLHQHTIAHTPALQALIAAVNAGKDRRLALWVARGFVEEGRYPNAMEVMQRAGLATTQVNRQFCIEAIACFTADHRAGD